MTSRGPGDSLRLRKADQRYGVTCYHFHYRSTESCLFDDTNHIVIIDASKNTQQLSVSLLGVTAVALTFLPDGSLPGNPAATKQFCSQKMRRLTKTANVQTNAHIVREIAYHLPYLQCLHLHLQFKLGSSQPALGEITMDFTDTKSSLFC